MKVNELMTSFTGQTGLAYGVDTAIKALRPNAKFDMVANGGDFQWPRWKEPNGLQPPSSQEIMAEVERQKRIAEYYQYAYDRCHKYPDGFEQLDMLWHAINDGVDLKESEWFKTIKKIKEDHPKPEGLPPQE